MDDKCRFFFFLRDRDTSVPDASERLGLPGLLRDFEDEDFFIPPSLSLAVPPCFSLRPEGVLVPVDAPECLVSSSAFVFFSACRRRRSASVSSDSLYDITVSTIQLKGGVGNVHTVEPNGSSESLAWSKFFSRFSKALLIPLLINFFLSFSRRSRSSA